jgi:hypothetical protein
MRGAGERVKHHHLVSSIRCCHVFRKPVWHNWLLCVSYVVLWATMTYLLLFSLPGGEPNVLHAIFHIASIQFNSELTQRPVWRAYQDDPDNPRRHPYRDSAAVMRTIKPGTKYNITQLTLIVARAPTRTLASLSTAAASLIFCSRMEQERCMCWGTFSSLPHGSPVPPGEQDATRVAKHFIAIAPLLLCLCQFTLDGCGGGAERREAAAGGIVDGASRTAECADGVTARLGPG